MAEIIKKRGHEEYTWLERVFSRDPERFTSGYVFECDDNGNPVEGMNPDARANFERGVRGEDRSGTPLYDLGVKKVTTWGSIPAVLRCDCGEDIQLAMFTNTCPCGADYNSAGQRLAPRSQWGEETGEHWSECI